MSPFISHSQSHSDQMSSTDIWLPNLKPDMHEHLYCNPDQEIFQPTPGCGCGCADGSGCSDRLGVTGAAGAAAPAPLTGRPLQRRRPAGRLVGRAQRSRGFLAQGTICSSPAGAQSGAFTRHVRSSGEPGHQPLSPRPALSPHSTRLYSTMDCVTSERYSALVEGWICLGRNRPKFLLNTWTIQY